LNTGLRGEIRYRISETNLYPYLFGVKNPIVHVMGFFVSILRERIANFEAPQAENQAVVGVSINDLRKNLRALNEHMDRECAASTGRYGITLDASLITAIDPPPEVESALAAINTAHNHVSSDVSLAQASADQKIVQSHRAVEIETLKAQAEVEPLNAQAEQLALLKASGPGALEAYLRNGRLALYGKADRPIREGRGCGAPRSSSSSPPGSWCRSSSASSARSAPTPSSRSAAPTSTPSSARSSPSSTSPASPASGSRWGRRRSSSSGSASATSSISPPTQPTSGAKR